MVVFLNIPGIWKPASSIIPYSSSQKAWCTPVWYHFPRELPLMVGGLSFNFRVFIVAFGFVLNTETELIQISSISEIHYSSKPQHDMYSEKWLSIQIFLPTVNYIYRPQLGSWKTLGKCNSLFCSVIKLRLQLQLSSNVLSALLNPAVPAVC